MKSLIFLPFIIIALLNTACNKRTAGGGSSTSAIYKGVVVINTCGNIAIETLAPDYLGETSWSAGSKVYHNIFAVQNGCQFGTHHEGDMISFKLTGFQQQQCAQCMIYVALPETKYAVQVIE